MSTTQTRTRARARTLSLIAARGGPSFATLPVELALDILELVILSSASSSSGTPQKPLHSHGRQQSITVTLATISRYITTLLNQILYRSVVLSTPRAVSLFARTVRSKDPSFFAAQVKRLSITAQTITRPLSSITRETSRSRESGSNNEDLQAILAACSSAKTLVLPEQTLKSFFTLSLSSQSQSQSHHITPSELTIGSLSDIHPWMSSSGRASEVLDNLTHLRVAEPGNMFVSPSSLLSALGPLPHLTHLHLNRRASANEDNDIAFVQDCEDVLRRREGLKMLIVSVFLPFYYSMSMPSFPAMVDAGADEDAEMEEMDEEKAREVMQERECIESSLWMRLQELKAKDDRLVIVQGQVGAWRKEWEGVSVIASATGAGDFWARASQRAAARSRKAAA